jgi:signal transduction histidine kinase
MFTGFWYDSWRLMLPLTGLFALAQYHLYHQRMAVRNEVQRIRAQIARDLHDDIGASLSQIALLSELLGRRLCGDPRATNAVIQIGSLSREVLDSVSNTVWSLDPRSDTVGDTIKRMRDFAAALFTARNIAFHFRAPSLYDDLELSAYARRQLFLLFKEGINNIVRHAECSDVEVDLAIDGRWLYLILSDNGKGFDSDRSSLGHGLNSMRERARNLGGQLQVASSSKGTRISLQAAWKARSGNARLWSLKEWPERS